MTGTSSDDINKITNNILDHNSIPLPIEIYKIHPTSNTNQGRTLLVYSINLAFTNSSEYSCGVSSLVARPLSTPHLAHT